MEQAFQEAAGFPASYLRIATVGITLGMLVMWIVWIAGSIVRAYANDRIEMKEAVSKATHAIVLFVVFFYYIAWLGGWR